MISKKNESPTQAGRHAAAQGVVVEQMPLWQQEMSFTKEFDEWSYLTRSLYAVIAHAARAIQDGWVTDAVHECLCSSLSFVNEINEELLAMAMGSDKKEVCHE